SGSKRNKERFYFQPFSSFRCFVLFVSQKKGKTGFYCGMSILLHKRKKKTENSSEKSITLTVS
ncbi:MAG: hypothetical protein LBQ50_05020, partial [Planctomycetaceae bacterium]|nr:hypothetical protein [Planctomycetaceae bacterium]